MTLLSVRREVGEFRKRYKWMALVVLLAFAVLLGRIVQLQLVDHDRWAGIANENITRTIGMPATRGIIRDAEGRVVATNRAAYNVYVTPQYLAPGDLRRLAELMGLDAEERRRLEQRVARVEPERRTHQIRVHMAHNHYPLVGDRVYGGRLLLPKGASPELIAALQGFKRQALHAARLAFEHPITGKPVEVTAPLPADMEALLAVLAADAKLMTVAKGR